MRSTVMLSLPKHLAGRSPQSHPPPARSLDKLGMTIMLVAVLLLTAIACGPAQAPLQTPQQDLQPKRGGVFHVPIPGGVVNLNPYSQSGASSNFVYPAYDNLLGREEPPHTNWHEMGQPLTGRLAERWERKDESTYVFNLRKNVLWHDGQPLTAADVVHTMNWLKENRGKVNDAARVLNMASVEASDPHTVVIKTTRPNPEFLKDDILVIEIAPKHVADAGKQLETTLVGTGPFMLKEFDASASFRLTRNDKYWRDGLPYIDGIVGHFMGDRGTMIAAFAAGTIDAMNPEDKVQLETVQNFKPDLSFDRFFGTYGYGLWFAIDQPPFSDVRVRRAINLAIDRQDMIVKAAFGDGMANPPAGIGWRKDIAMPQDDLLKLPGYNPATKQQDIQTAKRLMAEAGYPNGFATKLSYGSYLTNPKPIAEVSASQLKEHLSISITLAPVDRATNTQLERDNTDEMHTYGMTGESRSVTHDRLHSKGILNKRGPRDAELDALIEKLQAEFNPEHATKLSHQIQRRVYDQAYHIGAFERAQYTVFQPWLYDMAHNNGAQTVIYWDPPVAWLNVAQMPENRRTEKP